MQNFISFNAMLPSLSCILLTLHSGLNNLCFFYWKVIQNSFMFQLEPWCRQGLCGCTCHSLWGGWPEYTHWENIFLGCWILEDICAYTNEELYSSLTVVRRVVQAVLKHKKLKATPSFVKHIVLVKLTQEDDVACLHKQVYEWQGVGVKTGGSRLGGPELCV